MATQEAPLTPYEQAETAMMNVEHFKELVGRIALPEIIVPTPWARKPMTPLDDYRLEPIWGTSRMQGRRPRSISIGNYNNQTEPHVTVEYWELPHIPYAFCHINARLGMLLTKNNTALAVTSAGINDKLPQDEPAELVIRQIQGLIKNSRQPELAPALRAGFLWRDTFVAAWERIATQIPAVGRIALSPDDGTVPAEQAGAFWQTHRETADRMGYTFDAQRRLWTKPLVG